ncbi:MAG: hypothetical protein SXG53_04780 [Pseudomonadota bacterium]|nr:hypothetical protein [Pseudomonadota bacterium]
MRDLAILAIHFIATIAKLLLPGGARSVVSESLLLKHQLLILNRSRGRAPNLRPIDRFIASFCAALTVRPGSPSSAMPKTVSGASICSL